MKKIERVFYEFYEKHPLRMGLRPYELSKILKIEISEVYNVMQNYKDIYYFNGVCFIEKDRRIELNEKLKKIIQNLKKEFSTFKRISLNDLASKNSVNQKVIVNLINYLIDSKQIIELYTRKYYLTIDAFKKYKNKVRNALESGFRTTSKLKSILNLNRDNTVLLLEYMDKIGFTQFKPDTGERYLKHK